MIILFVDFDGVLCGWEDHMRKDKTLNLIDNFIGAFNKRKVSAIDRLFKGINDTVYFVPISSWGNIFSNVEVWNKFVARCGIQNMKRLESNPCIESIHSDRVEFIANTLKRYEPVAYTILDDEYSTSYNQRGWDYIKTDMRDGLTYNNFEQLASKVKSWEEYLKTFSQRSILALRSKDAFNIFKVDSNT